MKKVRGSYGTYIVKTKILSEEDLAYLYGILGVIFLVIIF